MENLRCLWPEQEKLLKATPPHLQEQVNTIKEQWWDKSFPQGEEFWKYVRFKDLGQIDFQLSGPQRNKNKVSFQGHSCHIHLSDLQAFSEWESAGDPVAGVEILPLCEVVKNDKLVKEYGKLLFKEGNHFFENINQSFLGSGFIVKLSKGTSLEKIEVKLSSKNKESFVNPRMIFIVEEGVQSQIIFETNIEGCQFVNISRDFYIASRSHLKVFSKEQGSSESYIMNNDNLYLQSSSYCQFVDMTLPSQWTRHNLISHLQGEGAGVHLIGGYLNDKKNFSDHHTIINHEKPSTMSRQTYKGILAGQARSVFNGRVYVAPGAEKSNSEQINKNLLLSEKAEVNTKPELQIYNDDVKAAHGATIGQLEPEQLFYLQSRGLKKEQAWKMLSEAFVLDLFEDIPDSKKGFFLSPIKETLKTFEGVEDEL